MLGLICFFKFGLVLYVWFGSVSLVWFCKFGLVLKVWFGSKKLVWFWKFGLVCRNSVKFASPVDSEPKSFDSDQLDFIALNKGTLLLVVLIMKLQGDQNKINCIISILTKVGWGGPDIFSSPVEFYKKKSLINIFFVFITEKSILY